MTTLWDELREQVAGQLDRRDEPWAPPELDDFRRCKVLAFDPSLSATGWVHLRVSRIEAAHRISVLARGTLRIRTAETGYMATYERASRLRCLVDEVVWREQHYNWPSVIAWEAPAVRGHRLESSLIAGLQVYEASHRAGTVISANHASSLLCGNPLHDKQEIAAAVLRYVPGSDARTWNQHERDAAAIALAYSLDLEEEPWLDDDDDIY
jgi:hypothetical protein